MLILLIFQSPQFDNNWLTLCREVTIYTLFSSSNLEFLFLLFCTQETAKKKVTIVRILILLDMSVRVFFLIVRKVY